MAAGTKTRVASTKLLDRRSRTALAADTLDEVKSRSLPPPRTTAELYKTVAPATVIIRVPGGMGSGIIIDPDGWVLTNHHVIQNGESEDFQITATVLIGKMSEELGAMERNKKTYKAEVYKSDKLRDIALLKLTDPPKDLPYIKISKTKPVPGDQITALGHAGAGMLWAVKSCQIAALGKLTEHLAQIAHFKDDENGRKALKRFRKRIESFQLGMVIQSTCNILPGDSGGPVVNEQGELIGLNVFTKRDRRTGGLLSFHVHLSEIQKFMKDRPDKAQQMLPDPWKDGGGDLNYEDADLDGHVDAIMMQGRKPCAFCPRQSTAVLFDVDQNSFKAGAPLPDLSDVYEKRNFDAEVIYLRIKRDAFIWYDTDNDGKFDVLLLDKGSKGVIHKAYRIDAKGELSIDEKLSGGKPLRASLFESEDLQKRFQRMASTAFPRHYSDASVSRNGGLPPALSRAGRGRRKDLNRDGTADAVDVSGAYSKRLLIDADGNFAPKMESRFVMAKIDPKTIDAEMSMVSQSNQIWNWYDTNDDGNFNLVLHAPGPRVYVAREAWTVDAQGVRTVAPQHIGRKLARWGVYENAAIQKQMKSIIDKGFLSIMAAKKDDGLASFPDPIKDHRGAGYQLLELRKSPRTVITIVGRGSDGYLLDLDRNSRLFGKKIDLAKKAKDGKLDIEFAYFQRAGIAWAFYDTKNKGRYDVVLVSTEPKSGKTTGAFRIDTEGAASYEPALLGGSLIRPSLLTNRRQARTLRTVAPELFNAAMVGSP
jgi:S1-C subfamily serine protease